MESVPPRIEDPKPVNRGRWWIHLILITSYILLVAAAGLARSKSHRPALSHTTSGLLLTCALELLSFGFVFGLAWLASRASLDDLLLRWRAHVLPVLLGVAYSVGLRIAVGILTVMAAILIFATQGTKMDSIGDFLEKNRPGIENAVDVDAMGDNPTYYILTLTVVSFAVAGFREELWRSSFLAGMKALWPRQFGSTMGQVFAVFFAAIIFGLAHLSMGILAALMAGVLGVCHGADHGLSPFHLAGGFRARFL